MDVQLGKSNLMIPKKSVEVNVLSFIDDVVSVFCHSNSSHYNIRASITFHHILLLDIPVVFPCKKGQSHKTWKWVKKARTSSSSMTLSATMWHDLFCMKKLLLYLRAPFIFGKCEMLVYGGEISLNGKKSAQRHQWRCIASSRTLSAPKKFPDETLPWRIF